MSAENKIIIEAAVIMRALLADHGDAAARAQAEEYIRQVREMQVEQTRAILGAGPSSPGFFGGPTTAKEPT